MTDEQFQEVKNALAWLIRERLTGGILVAHRTPSLISYDGLEGEEIDRKREDAVSQVFKTGDHHLPS